MKFCHLSRRRISGVIRIVVGACGLACSIGFAQQPTVSTTADLTGLWEPLDQYKLIVHTGDGQPIPLQPWALEAARGERARDRAGNPDPVNNQLCLPAGLIRQYQGNYPFWILQTSSEVIFLFEENHRYDIAYFNREHLKNLAPSWYGDSVAHWEDGTLVIDTVGTNGKTPLSGGIYHTADLHMIHHFKLSDDGSSLEDHVTMDDPKAYTRPWEVVTKFFRHDPRTTPFLEDVCAQNNLQLPSGSCSWQTAGDCRGPVK
jgi:hypothetical protein